VETLRYSHGSVFTALGSSSTPTAYIASGSGDRHAGRPDMHRRVGHVGASTAVIADNVVDARMWPTYGIPISGMQVHARAERGSWSRGNPSIAVRCLIVDDSTDFVAAARSLLERQGMTIVGVASTGADALRLYQQLRPDVTLVDIDLGGESGFTVAEQLHQAPSATSLPVILISTHDGQDFADMIAASPALGFVHKSTLTANAIRDLVDSSPRVEEGDHG
jgi:CheY-like chemotaxis protein